MDSFLEAYQNAVALWYAKVASYDYHLEEHILCEFIEADNLSQLDKGSSGETDQRRGNLLAEGAVYMNAWRFPRKFEAYIHIGDSKLFILGMSSMALAKVARCSFSAGSLFPSPFL